MYIAINTLGYTACSDCSYISDKEKVEEINKAESFSFRVYPEDPIYPLIRANKCSFITAYDDTDGVVFRGRIKTANPESDTEYSSTTVECEGPLGYLRDSVVWGVYAENTETVNDEVKEKKVYFMDVIGNFLINHNYQVSPELQFDPTIQVHNDHTITNDYGVLKESHNFDGVDTLTALLEILEDLDWECAITYTQASPHYTLHVAPRFGMTAPDPIVTGLNLKSLSEEIDGSELITAVFPLGGVGYDEKRLTLTDNGIGGKLSYLDEMPSGTTGGDIYNQTTGMYVNAYVVNDTLANKWGLHMGYVVFDDIVANASNEVKSARQSLREKAVDYAKKLADVSIEFDISAYELSKAGYSIGALTLHNSYVIRDTVADITVQARLTTKATNYDEPLESEPTFTVDSIDKESSVS